MKNILVIGASSSKNSINKQFAIYVASQIKNVKLNILNLNDFEMPIFSVDREEANGIPKEAKEFQQHIKNADLIVLSLAEHNGSYSAAFKNIIDWKSRLEGKIWEDKRMILLSTSPGSRGGASVMKTALSSFPFKGAEIIANFSLPFFNENFKDGKIVNEEIDKELKGILGEV